MTGAAAWPPLPLADWADTYATLHMWTQSVGELRLALTPPLNQWGHVPQHPRARGLTTTPMPCGEDTPELAFDFVEHRLRFDVNDGRPRQVVLEPKTVAAFYGEVMQALRELEMPVRIW